MAKRVSVRIFPAETLRCKTKIFPHIITFRNDRGQGLQHQQSALADRQFVTKIPDLHSDFRESMIAMQVLNL
jgi:hypothetical protein